MIVTLRNAAVELVLAPRAGGGIAAFRFEGQEVMRPAAGGAVEARDPLGLSSFPLVPYSNRIANGRFSFDGTDVQLPLNFGDHPHAIHGQGWQNPWEVAEAGETEARLVYHHPADAWPWAYRATQHFALMRDGFELTLTVQNQSERPMPAGLGLHPYYPKTPGMRFEALLDGWWETDEFVMPLDHRSVAPTLDWSAWLHAERTTDHVFSGWNGTAALIWPETGLRLTMTASDEARYMVVYAPAGGDICCVEPVTHPTDALNQDKRPSVRVLEPGRRMSLITRFRVERI